MFRSKGDIDKHVSSILSRRRDEKERKAQGYQIAKLYADIKEFSIARRYLSGFLSVRENVPSAFQLMGEINEGLDMKDAAIDNYKRALDLAGFVSSNRHLVQKICELYTDIGTDVPRMKYWLERLEKLDPKSKTIFNLKSKIAETSNENGNNENGEMENMIFSELMNRPTDLALRIKLLKHYMDTGRTDDAYDAAISCDLTTAFVTDLSWFECLQTVFKKYEERNSDVVKDMTYNQHYLHVLRNLVYLSLPSKDVAQCAQLLARFDKQLKHASSVTNTGEAWAAILKEMKGQLFFLASLVLLKRAQTGAVSWQDVNPMSAACLLASKSKEPIDAQAPWFVSAPATHTNFYNWWHQQSYDRLSQVGHLLQQLSQKSLWEDVTQWAHKVRRDTMTSVGHQRVFELLYQQEGGASNEANSFLYEAQEMVAGGATRDREPFTQQGVLDIDRVAYQVHLGNLNRLVWLCLQYYSADMPAQVNYHFPLMENIQFSVKNMENTAAETLCQLDLLVFLLASVHCAATGVSESVLFYADSPGRPSLLPVCLSRPLVTLEQSEWWDAAFRFCTNAVKDDFSRLRRVLVRGLETLRLTGSHGVSVKMLLHIARSLDEKVKSYRSSQYGARCPAHELKQLEIRAAFYWEKAKQALDRAQRNQHAPMPRNRLFKESGDSDLSPTQIKPCLDEAVFALAVHAMKTNSYEEAISGFEKVRTPWAKFYSAKIYKTLSDKENGEMDQGRSRKKALAEKARECLYDTIDRLGGDKTHELNVQIYKDLDELEVILTGMLDGDANSPNYSFHTPIKSPSELHAGTPQASRLPHSTPRPSLSNVSQYTNGATSAGRHSRGLVEGLNNGASEHDISSSSDFRDNTSQMRPRPSPERLDAQLRSVSYRKSPNLLTSQSSMLKMVLDRNDELITVNSKLMEGLRDISQLKTVLSDNQSVMSDLKTFLAENRDMMKQIKNELSGIKASLAAQQHAPPPPPIAPTPPLYLPPHHMAAAGMPPPRGPAYPGFPPPPPSAAYPHQGYMFNTPMGPHHQRPQVPPHMAGYRPAVPPHGAVAPNMGSVGKYRSPSDEDDSEIVDPDDLTSAEEAAALYAEFCEDTAGYSQYFTPEAHIMQDWAGRPSLDGSQMSIPPPHQAGGPRMSMPSPGYFASALRGPSLQYAQSTRPPAQVKPPPLGPGFFSSPMTSSVGAATPAPPSGSVTAGTPSLLAALTGSAPKSPGVPSVASTPVTAAAATTTASSGGSTMFGGFSFSQAPVVGSTSTPAEKPKVEANTPAAAKTETAKPFANFSLTAPAATPSTTVKPASSPAKSPAKSPQKSGGGDEDHVEEYEPNVDFKPVIALPELVEKTTGEENETAVFVERCRLYRFDNETKQWKERGVGELKILSSNEELKFRVIMRRDQIFKLCANHCLASDMKLTPMPSSDRAWCYTAQDYSDETMKLEQLAARFKTTEKATSFKDIFTDCCRKLKEGEEAKTTPARSEGSSTAKDTTVSTTTGGQQPSLAELFKPKAGSWECDGCLVRNPGDVVKCPACGNVKPGATAPPPASAGSSVTAGSSSGFSFGNMGAKGTGFNFGTQAATTTTTTISGFTFGAAPNSTTATSSVTTQPSGGFKFGGPPPVAASNTVAAPTAPAPTGFVFGGPPVTAAATGKPNTSTATTPAPTGFVFGGPPVAASNTTTPAVKPNTATHAPTGFVFGGPPVSAAQSGSVGKPAASTTTSGGGFVFKQPGAATTVAGSGAPSVTSTTTTSSVSAAAAGFSFKLDSSSSAPPKTTASSFGFGSAASTSAKPGLFSITPSTTATTTSGGPPSGLLAKLLTGDAEEAKPTVPAVAKPTGGFNFSMTPKKSGSSGTPSASSSSTSQGGGFQFSFNKSPQKPATLAGSPAKPTVPRSPEVDEHGLYITKDDDGSHIHFEPVVALPDKIEVKTGEEDETVLFESRGKMYRFSSGEWKEKGLGIVKILEHKETKRTRILMRREQILKICCNHNIEPSLTLQPMAKTEGKAWVWYAMDFSEEEGKMEQLALRFKTADIASEFKTVFDKCRDAHVASPAKSDGQDRGNVAAVKKELFKGGAAAVEQPSSTAQQDDDDVIFVKEEKSPFKFAPVTSTPTVGDSEDVVFVREEKATPAQVAQARTYKLPDNFYLYESKPPCPGCLGCTDGELTSELVAKMARAAKAKKGATKQSVQSPEISSATSSSTSPIQPARVFGGAVASTPISSTTTSKPLFGSSPAFGAQTTSPKFGTQATTTGGLFGQQPVFRGASSTPGGSSTFGGSMAANLPDFSKLTADTTKPDNSTTTSSSTGADSSSSGFVFGSGASVDFSSLAASSGSTPESTWKKSDSGPFSFAGAGQKLFGAGGARSGSGGGDADACPDGVDAVAPSEDIHFEPVIPLPDLVEVKTGEEEWKSLFCHRSKLYKFHKDLGQWKERGIGDIKIMEHNSQPMFRVLQRREQVLKVSCNHLISTEMEIKPMSTSETAWCWTAQDFTETEPSVEQFAVKFKTKETALEFKTVFEKCQETLKLSEGRQAGAPNKQAEAEQEEEEDDDDEDYEDDDDDDDEDEEEILFEKRATLSSFENGSWKSLGTGTLLVTYNEDINGNGISFTLDSGVRLCSHVITRELYVTCHSKNKSCEWKPIDYSTDEPVRRHFAASFSSTPAVQEFREIFDKGRQLAVESDLSENIPNMIDVPEVFSSGEARH